MRALHVLGAAVVLGGAALAWAVAATAPDDERRAAVLVASRYEWAFWVAVGTIVASGVGNLGAFSDGVPGSDTRWGATLLVKLLFVGAFLIFSGIRTFAVIDCGAPHRPRIASRCGCSTPPPLRSARPSLSSAWCWHMAENGDRFPLRSLDAGPLLPLALSAFHVSLLTVIGVVLLYVGGGLEDGLGGFSTAGGFGVFALLWAATWYATRRATEGLRWREPPRLATAMERGGYWGGISGAIIVAVLAAVILAITTSEAIGDRRFTFDGATLAGLFMYLLLAGIVAFAVGGLLGVLFAALDRTLLALARAIVGE